MFYWNKVRIDATFISLKLTSTFFLNINIYWVMTSSEARDDGAPNTTPLEVFKSFTWPPVSLILLLFSKVQPNEVFFSISLVLNTIYVPEQAPTCFKIIYTLNNSNSCSLKRERERELLTSDIWNKHLIRMRIESTTIVCMQSHTSHTLKATWIFNLRKILRNKYTFNP